MYASWQKCCRDEEKFLRNNSEWLGKFLTLDEKVYEEVPLSSIAVNSKRSGRPRKLFHDCCEKVKRRKAKSLLGEKSPSELVTATQISLRASEKRDAADLVGELASASPQRATKLRKSRALIQKQQCMSANEALALMIDLNLSNNAYKELRKNAKQYNCNIYPSLLVLSEAKKLCYPTIDSITVTEVSAEIVLQSLLDHTASRICQAQEGVLNMNKSNQLTLISKWGCDGSSDHSRYKQAFSEDSSLNDEHLFAVSLVPLQLFVSAASDGKKVVWQNPTPSSSRYCRPIKICFKKESFLVINEEIDKVRCQIKNLKNTRVAFQGQSVLISHKLCLTMVDGKVCSALSGYKATQRCYLCGASPKEMNSAQDSREQIDIATLEFGIAPLHAWIKCFECLLHISYRLEVKKWAIKNEEDKKKVEIRKKTIQSKFKQEMGLLVDMPKKSAGNTNDGNTARRFFRNPHITSKITGIDENLINRLRVILETISCGYAIQKTCFELYLESTKNLYLELYNWYYMPMTLHKILIHGIDIIQFCILPIGQLSEEAQETRNKDFRRYREYFTRKSSRCNTVQDLIHRLLISSDPFITALGKSHKPSTKEMSPEVLELLSTPPLPDSDSDTSEF